MRFVLTLIFLLIQAEMVVVPQAVASQCVGRFLNPVTEICWSCIFPITVGKVPLMQSTKFKDTENPTSPVCFCNRGKIPMVPGISVGFWEPLRIIEVTNTP